MSSAFILLLACVAHLISLSHAYTWTFNNIPSQCSQVSASIEGTGGEPPYNILIIPYGSSPLTPIEVRTIQTIAFNSSTDVDFTLNYPAGSQFVAVVSDSNGFATGGTSTVWTVQASDADLCFDPSQNILPLWPYFFVTPDPGLSAQSCETYRIGWTTGNPNITGTPNFVGVIPSGDSFNITSTPTTDSDGTTGFNWTVPVKAGTDLLLVSGDQHATGAGGYVDYKVASPSDPTNTACFSFMPSATAGTPAGGNLPTSSTSATSTPDNGNHGKNVGAIAGGVVGGIVALAVLAGIIFFLLRRQGKRDQVDIDEGPQIYLPHDTTSISTTPVWDGNALYSAYDSSTGRPYSHPTSYGSQMNSISGSPLSQEFRPVSTGTVSSQALKMSASGQPRATAGTPVSIIRHVDSERAQEAEGDENVETVELPPLYENASPRS